MVFKQVGDILEEIKGIYDNLYSSYESLEEHLNKDTSTEVIKYVKNKKLYFSSMIDSLKNSSNDDILKSWIQFSPEYGFDSDIRLNELHKYVDIDELNQIVIGKETWLLGFFLHIMELSISSRVKEVFKDIYLRQKVDSKKLSTAVNILQDM